MKNEEIKVESFVSTGKLNAEIEDIKKAILAQKMPKKISEILLSYMDIIKEYLKV